MQSTFTPSRSSELEPLVRVEARVVQERGRAAQPRRDERVAGRLRPARGRRAPDELAGLRREPVLGLQLLAGEVALAVQHRLGLARGARGERDQARIQRPELGGRRHLAARAGRATAPTAPARPSRRRRARPRCARRRRRAAAARRRAAAAGPSAAAAPCTAARRSPRGSRRPSSAPTRAGCRAGSGRRRRAPRRARPARRRARGRPRPPRPSSTRAARRRARSSPSRAARGPRPRRRRARSSSPRAYGGTGGSVPTAGLCSADGRRDIPLRQDRRAEGDHRDGPPVRRRADHPQGRALRRRGRVPGADRRADEGARAVRGHDPRGVRRDGARPDDLHDDRRGALTRLDLDLRRRQHPLHRLLPADEVRHRRAEGAPAAADGDRRDPRRVLPVRARARLRRPGDQVDRHEDGRRRLRDQRPEDVGHERPDVRRRLRARQDRPRGEPALQGHDLLHLREGARRGREPGPDRPAQDQEDGLQGRRVDRARLRRLPLPGRRWSSAARRPGSARASSR